MRSILVAAMFLSSISRAADWEKQAVEGYADSHGVKIHYVTLGKGPLVVMMHGFPDFWYTWRNQMPALARHYQVVAFDLRGYNLSDKPKGVENYKMTALDDDALAVIHHFGKSKAIIVGHDWGAAIGWSLAALHPEAVERLIVLSVAHPKGTLRELVNNPKQRASFQYALNFQKQGAHLQLTPEGLAQAFIPKSAQARYIEALRRTDFEAMLNYYKANFPSQQAFSQPPPALPNIKAPVLFIYPLKQPAGVPEALNGTWDWVDRDLTILALPNSGHFVQWDCADLVTRTIEDWLAAR